jgi:hypothetical protein
MPLPFTPQLKGEHPSTVREGWADGARTITERGEDTLVMGEFGNQGDDHLCAPSRLSATHPVLHHQPLHPHGRPLVVRHQHPPLFLMYIL